MYSLKEPIKLNNSFSYNLLFEKLEDRNKKRMSQFSKRKKALSTNQKKREMNKIITPTINISNKNKEKINEKDIINIFNLIINGNSNEIKIEKKIIKNIDNINIKFLSSKSNYNNINKENSLSNKNKIYNNNNDLVLKQKKCLKNEENYSNSSKNLTTDINKEVNISNLEEEKENKSNNINGLNENNEFALKFFSSSNDTFVQLGNNLTTKLKIQNNYFTESYSQALGCDMDNPNKNKLFNIKNFDDIEIIKEEKEGDTPLKRKKNDNECSNKLFSIRKRIKILKEKRKSKSLTKELYILSKMDNDKKAIDNIIISFPHRNKNNGKYLKKAKTKIQLLRNKNKNFLYKKRYQLSKIININSNNKIEKDEIKVSLTQKHRENKINNNQMNQNKLFTNINKYFSKINNVKPKVFHTKPINNNIIKNDHLNQNKNNNNIKRYINYANNTKNKNTKSNKMKLICIREKKNNMQINSFENSDENNNSSNKNKKNKTLINNKISTVSNINNITEKTENKSNKSSFFNNGCDKNILKIISLNNSNLINMQKVNINKKKKETIHSIKLINKNCTNYTSAIDNDSSFNKVSPKKEKNKINKSSKQSPFRNNNTIKINNSLMNKYTKNNIQNQSAIKSNKVFKKNISFYGNEKEDKKLLYCSNKKNNVNRTIFINNCNNSKQKEISSNYAKFNKEWLLGKNNNIKKNKFLNNSVNNTNFDKLKSNKSSYLYIDINSYNIYN